MRKGMIQLWADLEQVADQLGIEWSARMVRKVSGSTQDYSNVIEFRGRGPRQLRCNSTYFVADQRIEMGFTPDMTPAYKAAIFAHEIGHHLSRVTYGEGKGWAQTGPGRIEEEKRATYHGYELLYSLTKGRVPLGCIDLFNISLASYGAGEQL